MPASSAPETIKQISVIGSGLMGHGIALEFLRSGFDVVLSDVSSDMLAKAQALIAKQMENRSGAKGNLECVTLENDGKYAQAAGSADLVIEAAPEKLELKQRIFRALDEACPAHAILSSNTSTLLPSKLAAHTSRPDKVVVLHFVNPPYLVPLVEVVGSEKTSSSTIERCCHVLEAIGKKPVALKRELPGFILNRLQAALLRESLSLVEQGYADPEDIDTVISSSIGRRWAAAGIFEVFDLGGWDVITALCENLFPEIESSDKVPQRLRDMAQKGQLGAKTGEGFYHWDAERADQARARVASALKTLSDMFDQ